MARKRNRSSDSSDASSSDDDVPERKKSQGIKAISKAIVSSDSSSSSSDDDGEWNAKPKAKAKGARGRPPKKPAPKPVKRKLKASDSEESDSDDDEDEPKTKTRARFEEKEEGEVEDNDSDNDDDDNDIEEFNDGFDENLMGDEEDQRKLANMTEKEREQELFNRSEKREILKTRFEIERKLRLAKKQEKKKTVTDKEKNKSKEKDKDKNDFSAFVESSSRSVERRRNMEDKRKVKDAIKGLKAEREKKKLKQKLKATDVYSDSSDSDSNSDAKPSKKNTKQSSSSDSSSSSSISDDDSDTDVKAKSGEGRRRGDTDWDKNRSSDAEEEQFNFALEHLNAMRVSRFKMEQWCHSPFFKDTVVGCFVRIGAGQFAKDKGAQGYMVGQITDVVDQPKVYILGKTKTNKAIKLKHAKIPERTYRLEYISNSEFIMPEFEKWYTKMIVDNCDFPSRDFVERKKNDILKALNYQFSDADIEMIIAEKGKFKDKPVNFAMKKSQLLKDKEYAELNGDHAKAMELTREIDQLEDEAKRRDKVRTSNIAAISFINERNRMRNIKEAERAIAEEKTQKESQNIKDDPFTRRKCAPMMISNFNKKGEPIPIDANNGGLKLASEQNNSKDSPDSASSQNSSLPPLTNGTKSAKTLMKPAADNDDLFNAHDFDIKIDFELPLPANSTSTSILPNISNGRSDNGFADTRAGSVANVGTHRRSLNLDEYKKKKGLI